MTAGTGWQTSITPDEIVIALQGAQRVAIATHSKPDGDALGSSLALCRALNRAGVYATSIFTGPWPHRFDSLLNDTPIIKAGADFNGDGLGGEPDVIVVTDTGSWSQLTELADWLRPRTEKTIVIDHHLHGDGDTAARRLIDRGAAAVSETLAPICAGLLGLSSVRDLPRDVAEPLYLGIASDTGWFRHANVKASSLRTAAELLEAGVSHALIYQATEQGDRVQRLLLMGRVLNSLELHADERVAISVLTAKDFEECGAGQEDSGGFAELGLGISTVLVSATITQVDDARCKVSFRSKSGSDGRAAVDVNETAMALGGGGHAQAAGAKMNTTLADAKNAIVRTLLDQLR